MILDIEQFTAPGKHAIDLKMEEINKELKEGKSITNYQEKIDETNTTQTKYNRMQNK